MHQIALDMILPLGKVHAYIAFFVMHVASKAMLLVDEDDESSDWLLLLHCYSNRIGRTLSQQAWLQIIITYSLLHPRIRHRLGVRGSHFFISEIRERGRGERLAVRRSLSRLDPRLKLAQIFAGYR